MACYQTEYHSLSSVNEDADTPPENDVIFHVPLEKSRWNHIEDLDSFFRKIYHQKHGFLCIITNEIYGLVQFIFIVIFTVYIANCVDYDVVGKQISYQNATYVAKLKITDLIIDAGTCAKRCGLDIRQIPYQNATYVPKLKVADLNIDASVYAKSLSLFTWTCLGLAIIFWIYYFCRTVYCAVSFYEIKNFYNSALKIPCSELDNTTWHEVQCKLREVQQEQQMCIHKQDLSELDIYHRILRHENYMVAMMNKNILPLKYNLPKIGEIVYFPSGLRFNIELLLFRSPISPFKSTWQLKDDYKKFNKRSEIAAKLSKFFLLLGIFNLLLSPFIFLWQLLSFCVNYAGHIRKEPGFLGVRKWSQYSRLYLRHFNELEHELTARLNRAYSPSCHYVNSFCSHLLTIHARNIAAFAGVIAIFIICWSAIQNDVIEIEYLITTGACASFVCHSALSFVPNENLVFVPKTLMTRILADIHYMPDSWKDKEHTQGVRNEFSQLFQLKISYILEQLMSPLFTPLVLIFRLRHRSLDIVDFFRSFTVEVAGVGDVCSFALMDISRHGNYHWIGETHTKADQFQQAENGKTELSLVHFTMTNPHWHPPPSSNVFIANLREQAQRDASELLEAPEDNALNTSLNSLQAFGAGHASYADEIYRIRRNRDSMGNSMFMSRNIRNSSILLPAISGGVSLSEGPLLGQTGILSSLQANNSPADENFVIQPQHPYEVLNPMEYRAAEMSFSALYLHELHYKRLQSLRQATSVVMDIQPMQPLQVQERQHDDDEETTGNENAPLIDIKKRENL